MNDPITIGVEGKSHTVLCGFCKAPITERIEPTTDEGVHPPAVYGCTQCDNWAEQPELVRLVQKYVVDEGQVILNRLALDAARKSKIMTFHGKTEHDTVHPFIVKLDI